MQLPYFNTSLFTLIVSQHIVFVNMLYNNMYIKVARGAYPFFATFGMDFPNPPEFDKKMRRFLALKKQESPHFFCQTLVIAHNM